MRGCGSGELGGALGKKLRHVSFAAWRRGNHVSHVLVVQEKTGDRKDETQTISTDGPQDT